MRLTTLSGVLIALGGLALFDLAVFGLAFLGKVGGEHHAWHVLLCAAGIEGIIVAFITFVTGIVSIVDALNW